MVSLDSLVFLQLSMMDFILGKKNRWIFCFKVELNLMEVRLHKSLGRQAYQFYKRNSRREVEAGSLIDLCMSLQESQVI